MAQERSSYLAVDISTLDRGHDDEAQGGQGGRQGDGGGGGFQIPKAQWRKLKRKLRRNVESDDRMTEAEERAVRALVFLFFVRSCCLFVCWLVGLVFVVTVVVAAAAVVVAVVVAAGAVATVLCLYSSGHACAVTTLLMQRSPAKLTVSWLAAVCHCTLTKLMYSTDERTTCVTSLIYCSATWAAAHRLRGIVYLHYFWRVEAIVTGAHHG